MAGHYQHRLTALSAEEDNENAGTITDHQRHRQLVLESLRIERQTAVRLRNERKISDETLRELERELDLKETDLQE